MHILADTLLDLIISYFVEDFCIYIHQTLLYNYLSLLYLFLVLELGDAGLIKGVWDNIHVFKSLRTIGINFSLDHVQH